MTAELRIIDAVNLLQQVPVAPAYEVGAHFGGCWRHHAPCLASYTLDFLDPSRKETA